MQQILLPTARFSGLNVNPQFLLGSLPVVLRSQGMHFVTSDLGVGEKSNSTFSLI